MPNASQWDRDSGLVFSEQIVRQRRSDRKAIEFATAREPPRYTPLTRGTQTLREIAQRCLLHNLHLLDDASLSGVSEDTLASVWTVIVNS
nr:hypothetical protein B0A51_15424 [Rachicladosporium sp. CCFEE 5018]